MLVFSGIACKLGLSKRQRKCNNPAGLFDSSGRSLPACNSLTCTKIVLLPSEVISHVRVAPLVPSQTWQDFQSGCAIQVKEDLLQLLAAAAVSIAAQQGAHTGQGPSDSELEAATGLEVPVSMQLSWHVQSCWPAAYTPYPQFAIYCKLKVFCLYVTISTVFFCIDCNALSMWYTVKGPHELHPKSCNHDCSRWSGRRDPK